MLDLSLHMRRLVGEARHDDIHGQAIGEEMRVQRNVVQLPSEIPDEDAVDLMRCTIARSVRNTVPTTGLLHDPLK